MRKFRNGLSKNQYNHLLEQQGGVCGVCGRPPAEGGRKLAVDHNHETGETRGLLCFKCNYSLGILEKWLKKPDWLANLQTWLSRPLPELPPKIINKGGRPKGVSKYHREPGQPVDYKKIYREARNQVADYTPKKWPF